MLQVRLLGPVEVVHDGEPVPVVGGKRAAVLATLALRRGDLVSLDKVITCVWDDAPPATARNTVASHMSFLRRLTGGDPALVTQAPGYRLDLPPEGLDAAYAESLAAQARRLEVPQERIEVLEQAIALWRGPSLAGVSPSSDLTRHAERLDELRLSLTEDWLADLLRTGAHERALVAAQPVAAEHPLRERLTRVLMVALYRCGQRDGAREAFERHRRDLRRELDVAPSPALERLARRMAAHDPELLVPAGRSAPRQPAGPPARHDRPPGAATQSLPADRAAEVIGRAADLARVEQALGPGRMVTITGMGGVGKTTLAQVIQEGAQARGQRIVRLDGDAMGPESFVPQAAVILGVPDPGDGDIAQLAAALPSEALLCIDVTARHRAEAATLALAALDRGDLAVLVTSREPLGVRREQIISLASLGTSVPQGGRSPAAELFIARARDADLAFAVEPGEVPSIEEVCRRVGGLPLALVILGARMRSLTVTELLERLEPQVLQWPDERLGIAPRHRSLGAVLDVTAELLPPRDLAALGRLAHLEGGAWLDEAALLLGEPSVGEEQIRALLDRSLLTRETVAERSWIDVHSLVRLWSLGREDVDHHQAAGDHAAWVAQNCRASAADWHGPGEAQALTRRAHDGANLDAALEWFSRHDARGLPELVLGNWWSWYRNGQGVDGARWAARAIALAGPDSPGYAAAAAAAGYLHWLIDDYDAAGAYARQGLDLAGDDPGAAGFGHGVLARAIGDQGDFEAAVIESDAAIAAYERAGDRWGVAWSRRCLVSALLYGGDADAADRECTRVIRDFEVLDDHWGLAGSLDLQGVIASRLGQTQRALQIAADTVLAHQRVQDSGGERQAQQHLAECLWTAGRFEESRSAARDARELSVRHGYQVGELQAILLLADLPEQAGHAETMAELTRRADELVRRLGPAAAVSLELAAGRRADR